MNSKVAQFIASQEEHLKSQEKERRDNFLRSIGLVEETREYTTGSVIIHDPNYKCETVDGITRCYRSTVKPVEVTESEFQRIEGLVKEGERLKEALDASKKTLSAANKIESPKGTDAKDPITQIQFVNDNHSRSMAASFLRFLAWLLWLGGLIAAIMLSRGADEYYRSEFNWPNFLAMAVAYGAAGGLSMSMSEMCESLHLIASRFSRSQIQITKKDEQ